MPERDKGYDVYDGVVFTVNEVLSGELSQGENTVTVAIPALMVDLDYKPRFRILESPFEIVEPGIQARATADGPTYLVYVIEAEDDRSVFYKSGYFFFNTPGGVAPVLDDGKIGVGADRPLARPVVVENGTYRQIDHELELDDARAAAQTVLS